MSTTLENEVLTESASSSDADLMHRVASGDLFAFEQLVLRHQERAWAVAWHMLSDAAEAEDAVQEAFLKILRSASGYRPIAAFRTYLHHVLVRVCLDVRSKKRPDYRRELADVADQSSTPEQLLNEREQSAAVRRALASLPARRRAAIVLRHYEDLSYQEIAQVLGISSKAVDSLLQRARRSLRSKLKDLNY
jgi:RNA polymerase sigma-70 factor (ECF subfamily)